MKEYIRLIKQLNDIITKHNFEFYIPRNANICITFLENTDFKEQFYFILNSNYTIENFTDKLEEHLNLENTDSTAIFMYQKLRKTPLTLKETIDEAERRTNLLIRFAEILKKYKEITL